MGLSEGEQSLQRAYLFFAARRLLEMLASTQPLLVVFEDLHWADSGLLDLVEYLAAHLKDTPVVIVGLARPEFIDQRPGWGSGLFAHPMIGLEPLSSADATALAANLLAKVVGRKETVERLAEAAEGNPLFIEELTAAVTEGKELRSRPPTPVRAAIASPLRALPPPPPAILLDPSGVRRALLRRVLLRPWTHAH